MRRGILSVSLGVALWALSGSPAVAGPIGSVEWNDATFSIELLGSAGDLYTFKLTADFTGFVDGQAGDPGVDQEGHFAYLVGINFKPSNGNLTAINGTPSTNATGTFTYGIDSNLSSNSTDCSSAALETTSSAGSSSAQATGRAIRRPATRFTPGRSPFRSPTSPTQMP
jgi:hypothetical protein